MKTYSMIAGVVALSLTLVLTFELVSKKEAAPAQKMAAQEVKRSEPASHPGNTQAKGSLFIPKTTSDSTLSVEIK